MKFLLRGLGVAALIGVATQPASAFVIGDGGPLCAFMSIDCPPEPAPAPAAAAPAPVKHVAHHKHKAKPKA
ncbi:hypothetical protein [Beijerinckia sp. L45]|uniref:hypothetical protein n=1 Tax=Beijerinckia sp. L45 TaxID=1641855 RepID=UPI00131B08A9|nr:hypothetical protein [Beijerinckia sp. L45]